jgi:hypothetical protein
VPLWSVTRIITIILLFFVYLNYLNYRSRYFLFLRSSSALLFFLKSPITFLGFLAVPPVSSNQQLKRSKTCNGNTSQVTSVCRYFDASCILVLRKLATSKRHSGHHFLLLTLGLPSTSLEVPETCLSLS